ncbi:MAG: hypothetical protein HY290_10810 [Planctomycetia bacterium]|nr:hypothetical protein [Planctomycetia bacterium]
MSSAEPENPSAQLPDELPPVQPPSAGFIIQLFVVPGLIVLAIVAVYVMFGKLATGEQDWKSQIIELRHPNEHRRWRGATGIAQILKADQEIGIAGQRLSENREFAQALAELMTDELKRSTQSESDLKIQAYLERALGLFDLPDIALPPLELAMRPGRDRDVRKNAILAVAVMSDRMAAKKQPVSEPGLSDELIQASRDDDPLIRQLSAYTLGLFPEEWSASRLEVMLGDGDFCTRSNAAFALARQHDVRGYGVLTEVLKKGAQSPATEAEGKGPDSELLVALKNCLSPAIETCAAKFSPEQRGELTSLITPIAERHDLVRIRVDARAALNALRAAR